MGEVVDEVIMRILFRMVTFDKFALHFFFDGRKSMEESFLILSFILQQSFALF